MISRLLFSCRLRPALLFLPTLVIGCSLLASEPNFVVNDRDADASTPSGTDAASERDSAPSPEAESGLSAFCSGAPLFCSSFEDANLLGSGASAWQAQLQGGGTVSLSKAQATEGLQSLHATFGQAENCTCGAGVQKSVGRAAWKGVRLSFDLRWDSSTYWCENVGFPQSVAVVRFGPSSSVQAHVFVACTGELIASLSLPNDVPNPPTAAANAIKVGWNHVEVEFSPIAGSFKMSVDGKLSHDRSFKLGGGAVPPTDADVQIQIGLQRFGNAIGIPVDAYFDKIRLDPLD